MSDRIYEHVDEGDLCEAWWDLCEVGLAVSVRSLAYHLDVSRAAMRHALELCGYTDLIPGEGVRNP